MTLEQFFDDARDYLLQRARILSTMDRSTALSFMHQIASQLAPHLAPALQKNVHRLEELLDQTMNTVVDLDKAWAVIHFRAQRRSLGRHAAAGKRASRRKIDRARAALEPIPVEEFAARFDYPAMLAEQVYAVGGGEEEDLLYASHYYERVRSLYQRAAADGNAMLAYMD